MTERVLMEEMSWREIEEAIAAGKENVIQVAASIEQHGPHLPIGTDTYLGYALAEAAARKLGNTLVAPVIRPGLSAHHRDFPGTMYLGFDTFVAVLEDCCMSLARTGFRRIFIMSSHGGNTDMMVAHLPEIAKKIGPDRCEVFMVMPFMRAEEKVAALREEYGIRMGKLGVHSGYGETSMMLAIREELVNMDRAEQGRDDEDFYKPEQFKRSQLEAFTRGVKYQSGNGILGDARGANAEFGRKLIQLRVEAIVEEIKAYLK